MKGTLALFALSALVSSTYAGEVDACKRQPFRGRCPPVTEGGMQTRSQFVLRYYLRDGECVSYPFGHCSQDENEPKLYRYREECEDACLKRKGDSRQAVSENDADEDNSSWQEQTYGTVAPLTDPPKARPPTTRPASTPRTECERRRAAGEGSVVKGGFVPECSSNGEFLSLQCEQGGEHCFCVDRQGIEIPNSRSKAGKKPDCGRIANAQKPKSSDCSASADAGPCMGSMARWYYDEAEQTCRTFQYSGCGGNGNNYGSKAACEKRCGPTIGASKCHRGVEPLKTQLGVPMNCAKTPCPDGYQCSVVQQSSVCCPSSESAKGAGVLHSGVDADVCKLTKERGPCDRYELRFYYNSDLRECKYFFYGGCEGNMNNFERVEDCEKACGKGRMLSSSKVSPSSVAPSTEPSSVTPLTQPTTIVRASSPTTDLPEAEDADTSPSEVDVTSSVSRTTSESTRSSSPSSTQTARNTVSSTITASSTEPSSSTSRDRSGESRQDSSESTSWRTSAEQSTSVPVPSTARSTAGEAVTVGETSPSTVPATTVSTETKPSVSPSSSKPPFASSVVDVVDKPHLKEFSAATVPKNPSKPEPLAPFISPEDKTSLDTKISPLPENRCLHARDPGSCSGQFVRWYWNRDASMCEVFTYTGCNGNGNNFASREECLSICHVQVAPKVDVTDVSNVCVHGIDIGECKGAFHRFAFDPKVSDCRSFLYGGCGGNGNNFATYAECKRKCIRDPNSLPKNICEHPIEVGECSGIFSRYGYDAQANECRQFTYGGCGGNGNNFATLAECRTSCVKDKNADCPPLDVMLCVEPCIIFSNRRGCQECVCPVIPPSEGAGVPTTKPDNSIADSNFQPDMPRLNPSDFVPPGQELPSSPASPQGSVAAAVDPLLQQPRQTGVATAIQGADKPLIPLSETSDSSRSAASAATLQPRPVTVATVEPSRSVHTATWESSSPSTSSSTSTSEVSPTTAFAKLGEQCTQPLDRGQCENYSDRWYFNVESGRCEQFRYGGCAGNRNHFFSQRECDLHCTRFARPQSSIDSQPQVVQLASAAPERSSEGQGRAQSISVPEAATRQSSASGSSSQQSLELLTPSATTRGHFPEPEPEEMLPVTPSRVVTPGAVPLATDKAPASSATQPRTASLGTAPTAATGAPITATSGVSVSTASARPKAPSVPAGKQQVAVLQPPKQSQQSLIMPIQSPTRPFGLPQPSLITAHFAEEGNHQSGVAAPLPPQSSSIPEAGSPPDVVVPQTPPSASMEPRPEVFGPPLRPPTSSVLIEPPRFVHQPSQNGGRRGGDETCSQPPDPGMCFDYVPRWFYNAQSGKCEQFSYGSCGGNTNNFMDRQICEARCQSATESIKSRVPVRCTLDKDEGTGGGYNVKWYFNIRNLRCEQMVFQGDGGNLNQFNTLGECQNSCTPTEGPHVSSSKGAEEEDGGRMVSLKKLISKQLPAEGSVSNAQATASFRGAPILRVVHEKDEDDAVQSVKTTDALPAHISSPTEPSPSTTTAGTSPAATTVLSTTTEEEQGAKAQQTVITHRKGGVSKHHKEYHEEPILTKASASVDAKMPILGPSPPMEVNYQSHDGGRASNRVNAAAVEELEGLPAPKGLEEILDEIKTLESTPDVLPTQRIPVCPNGRRAVAYSDGRPVMCLPGKNQCPENSVCYFNGIDFFCCPNADDPYDKHIFGGYDGDEERHGYKSLKAQLNIRTLKGEKLRAKRDEHSAFSLDRLTQSVRIDTMVPHPHSEVTSAKRMKFRTKGACALDVDPGRCTEAHLRYYYDRRADACRLFYYSGCDGNENNFATEFECQQKCKTGRKAPTPPGTCPGGRLPLGDNAPVLCGNESESIACPAGYYCRMGPPNICCPDDIPEPALEKILAASKQSENVRFAPNLLPPPPPSSIVADKGMNDTTKVSEVAVSASKSDDDMTLATSEENSEATEQEPSSTRPPPPPICPDGADPLMDSENAQPVKCGTGFDGESMCPIGFYCSIDLERNGRLCCPLGSHGSKIPPPPIIAPFFGMRPSNPGEVIGRGSLPSDEKPQRLRYPKPLLPVAETTGAPSTNGLSQEMEKDSKAENTLQVSERAVNEAAIPQAMGEKSESAATLTVASDVTSTSLLTDQPSASTTSAPSVTTASPMGGSQGTTTPYGHMMLKPAHKDQYEMLWARNNANAKAMSPDDDGLLIDVDSSSTFDEDPFEMLRHFEKFQPDRSVCQMRPSEGRPCTEGEIPPRSNLQYFYSLRDRRCKLYFYRGCGGNKNRFEKKRQCEELCMGV